MGWYIGQHSSLLRHLRCNQQICAKLLYVQLFCSIMGFLMLHIRVRNVWLFIQVHFLLAHCTLPWHYRANHKESAFFWYALYPPIYADPNLINAISAGAQTLWAGTRLTINHIYLSEGFLSCSLFRIHIGQVTLFITSYDIPDDFTLHR